MKHRYVERYKYLDSEDNLDVLGGGFGFPVEVDNTGRVQLQIGSDHVGSCVKHFCMYDYTDLVGTPTFGGGVLSMQWKIMTTNLVGIKQNQIQDGLENWEPRIEEVQVVVGKSPSDDNEMVVKIYYRLKSTGDTEYTRFSVPRKEGG